jgi:deoxyribonuclease V
MPWMTREPGWYSWYKGRVFAAVDVHYLPSDEARAALVVAASAAFSEIIAEKATVVSDVAPYQPGAFYLRELPCLRAVLAGERDLSLLVVDGYVDLDPAGKSGLGKHAHDEFGVPVIGVAKTQFATATHAVPVLRGTATRPLWITAVGLPIAEAAATVQTMAGNYRLPDALRRVDTIARHGLEA